MICVVFFLVDAKGIFLANILDMDDMPDEMYLPDCSEYVNADNAIGLLINVVDDTSLPRAERLRAASIQWDLAHDHSSTPERWPEETRAFIRKHKDRIFKYVPSQTGFAGIFNEEVGGLPPDFLSRIKPPK